MSKKRIETVEIGIDLDGVVANFAKAFSIYANKFYGCPIINHEKEILLWDWEKWYPISKEQVRVVWKLICETDNFWKKLEVLDRSDFDYMRDSLQSLKRANIYFITTRVESKGESVKKQSEEWLRMNGWTNPTVIVCKEKGKMAALLDLDFFIDDKTENIVDVKLAVPDCLVYARDVPHNHNCEEILGETEGYKRVTSTRQFADDIVKWYQSYCPPDLY